MLALTLTAIAAGIAGTTLTAARRTAETITLHERTAEADARLRALLTDMLRHGAPAAMGSGARGEEALLRVTPTRYGGQLVFLSRGVTAPFGTGPVWRVTLGSDGEALVLDAEPVGARDGDPVFAMHTSLPGITHLDVEVLEPATAFDGARWRGDWPLAQARPAAVSLDWSRDARDGAGRESARDARRAPLVVALDPLAPGTP